MADWVTISSLATAGGTLVLAVATFSSVKSANRSARVAERSLLEHRRHRSTRAARGATGPVTLMTLACTNQCPSSDRLTIARRVSQVLDGEGTRA